MFQKIGLVLLLSISLVTTAHAQSLDGTYRGRITFIKDVELLPGADRCTASETIEFRIIGSTIETKPAGFAQVLVAPLAADGSFRITGQRPSRSPTHPIVAEYTGTVKNSRIEGTSRGQGPGRVCDFTFSARKR